ncbi:hypothetical protein C0J52_25142 [Blattella germanica]|nr:hypothetical protein C0J52_25142 [Blattella germanica]
MPQPSRSDNEVHKKYRLLTMDTPNHQQYTALREKTYNQIAMHPNKFATLQIRNRQLEEYYRKG